MADDAALAALNSALDELERVKRWLKFYKRLADINRARIYELEDGILMKRYPRIEGIRVTRHFEVKSHWRGI